MMRRTGWRLVPNWGNYGAYGWGLGAWLAHTPGQSQEDVIVAQLGPLKVMWRRREVRE